jgi:hypothetical protein
VAQGDTATTQAPVPTNAQGQSNTDCAAWYLVLPGDDCAAISLRFGISLDDFYFLNPQINSTCGNLWSNTSYCVEAVGNIATYSGYTISVASTSFTRPVTTQSTIPPYTAPTLNPQASGTIAGCVDYENAFNTTDTSVNSTNSCDDWAAIADVTVSDLIAWNPSLSASDCVFLAGYSYCVVQSNATAGTYCIH